MVRSSPPRGSDPILVADIGGTSVKFGVSVNATPQSYRRLYSTELLRAVENPITIIAEMIREVMAESGIDPVAIVATVPGFIDRDFDKVLFAGNIPGLNGRFLATELQRLVGVPVVLERDAVMALTGEILSGGARAATNVVGMFFGTGIGAAYIVDGEVFRGGGWALEVGHMPFRGDGRQYEGMRQDCLEAYASGRALAALADSHGVGIAEIFLRQDDSPDLRRELDRFVTYQSFAVATAIALFSPDTVVLGGGVLDIEGYPRERFLATIDDHAPIAETGRILDVRWAEHGWASALHGAQWIVNHRWVQNRVLSAAEA